MCLFAYLYVRPLIRRRLGSASRGYINWTTIYVVWLCAAVFYHLPSLDSLGLDVRADLSMLLTVFFLSLLVLGALSAGHFGAIALRVLSPRLLGPTDGALRAFTVVILNSMNLAIACSTYYSLCGNAPAGSPASAADAADAVRSAVCGKWLHPLSAVRHPAFSSWVIYGEASGGASDALGNNATAGTEGVPAILTVQVVVGAWGGTPPIWVDWVHFLLLFSLPGFCTFACGTLARILYPITTKHGILSFVFYF